MNKKLSTFEKFKFLAENFSQYFSLYNGQSGWGQNESNLIHNKIAFSNIEIRKQNHAGQKYTSMYLDINLSVKHNIDLDYILKSDYYLLFEDKVDSIKRISKFYVKSFIIDKKNDKLLFCGTATGFTFKLAYRLHGYIIDPNLTDIDLINYKINALLIEEIIENRFEILDL